MGVKERRDREREEIRSRIVDAARKLFAEHGYDAVSMRKVADAVEYSATAIYVHFADKAALLQEVVGQDFARLAGVFTALADIVDPIERLRACGRTYIDFAVANPQHYKLMFMTPLPKALTTDLPAECLEGRGDPAHDAYAFLRNAVTEAAAAGRLRDPFGHPELAAQTLWAAVHGVASLEIAMADDPWIEHLPIASRREAICDAILGGMLRVSDTLRVTAPAIKKPRKRVRS